MRIFEKFGEDGEGMAADELAAKIGAEKLLTGMWNRRSFKAVMILRNRFLGYKRYSTKRSGIDSPNHESTLQCGNL